MKRKQKSVLAVILAAVLFVLSAFSASAADVTMWVASHQKAAAVRSAYSLNDAVAPKMFPYDVADANMDGSVTIEDANLILKYLTLQKSLSDTQLTLADADYDGAVTVNDATRVQKIISMLYTPLTGKKGVDISFANGDVDMRKIKAAGYDFVMIRCGYGDDYTSQDDLQFENNVKKCEELNIPWGVYIYSYALTVGEAKSEAAHVLRLLKGKKPTLPIAFDMEDADGYKSRFGMPSNATLVKICKTFISEIKSAGYYTMLYANLDWLKNRLADEQLLDSTDLWYAQWNSTCDYQSDKIGMWQYGGEVNFLESNYIEGVGVIDKSFCFKDYPAIIKGGHYNGW